jgi:hypothetical protein
VDAPPVEPIFERYESDALWDQATFLKVTSKVDVRLQIRNKAKDRMIQVQNGRFFYNWLGTPGSPEYPSYDFVRPEFNTYWDKFRTFILSEVGEKSVEPNQWEVIYVNHIPRGTAWSELPQLQNVFNMLRDPGFADIGLKNDGIGGEWRYEISPKRGRLYIKLGTTTKEEIPCVVMTLIARGAINEAAENSIDEGLNLGHLMITNAFSRVTTLAAQRSWGLQNADN